MKVLNMLKVQHALRKIANTPEGLIVIKFAEESILAKSPLGSDTNETHYNIGQHDLIRTAISLVKARDDYNTIDIEESFYDEED